MQGLEQGMRQSMVANASMQLFMRTLQATTTELSQMTAQAVAANPALEELPPEVRDDEFPVSAPNYAATERHDVFMNNLSSVPTLREYLEQQILCSAEVPAHRDAALVLVGYLDLHGRLEESLDTIARDEALPLHALQAGLKIIQSLDPPGVGAADLQECLLLQLHAAGMAGCVAERILLHTPTELIRGDYAAIAARLSVSEQKVEEACRILRSLNPDPGSAFEDTERNVITPDLVVSTDDDGELTVNLTGSHVPHLGLSADYREMMAERADDTELRRYLSRCFREGRDLIQAIENRQTTLLSVARAIVHRQPAFFRKGRSALKAMKMQDIADELGVNVSTVSRAVNGKYLRCSHGVYELRSFFSQALSSSDGSGAVSAADAIARLKVLIDSEVTSAPYTDERLAQLLSDAGIRISRRTVAKYRDRLRIPPAHLRRRR